VVPLTLNKESVAGQDGCYATASLDKTTNELIIKFVNSGASAQNASFNISGAGYQKQVAVTTLRSDNGDAVNSLENPTAVSPVQSTASLSGKVLKINIEPYTLKVIRLKNK
jgi:alpha-N-arabinofuranosidase